MRFVLLVEGHTEHKALSGFFKRYLDAKLSRPVKVDTVRHDGYRDLIKHAPIKARLHLQDPRRGAETLAVIALLDLYGPCYPEHCKSTEQRLDWIKRQVRGDNTDPRFLVHCAVHETEAWLLGDPSLFPPEIRRALPGRPPEEINHDEPPAKLLHRLFRTKLRRDYHKINDGSGLFQRLDPDLAARRCPYLGQLLREMLCLAQARS